MACSTDEETEVLQGEAICHVQADLPMPKPLYSRHNMRRILAMESPAWLRRRWLGLSFWQIPLVQHERSRVCPVCVDVARCPQ